MKYLHRTLKVFLALLMLGLSLVTPLTATATEETEHQGYEDYEELYDDWGFD